MKLRRLGPGSYQTLDCRYAIIKDPSSGDEPLGWGYISWLTYDEEHGPEPMFEPVETLSQARAELEFYLTRNK